MLRTLAFACAFAVALTSVSQAAESPGVTAKEIRIGGIYPLSGPASSIGLIGRVLVSYAQSVNDRGGVNGRKINYIAYDDAYSPPKAVEQARKLVENDEIAFMFGQVGTPGNSAVSKYLASKDVPTIGIVSGSTKFTDVALYPTTTTSLVSFETEGRIFAKYLRRKLPKAKYAILYQNDDLGKDYLNAFRSVFKDEYAGKVVTAAYEINDPTVDSQVVSLKSSGADALVIAGTPKFAAQAIRKVSQIRWNAEIILNYPSIAVGAAMGPGGIDPSANIVVGAFTMDPRDPEWSGDAGMRGFLAFVEKYMPGADVSDTNYMLGYTQGMLLEQILKQCGDDLSRSNIVRQARNLAGVHLPTLLPGIDVSTSPQTNSNFTQMRLQRWTAGTWKPFGDVLDAASE